MAEVRRYRPRPETVLLVLAGVLFSVMLFKHLAHPLFWSDEAETAMFGTRVLEYGYPKVHGPRNVCYQFGPNIALGVKESLDAYIGTTWGHFYFAAPGLLWARGVDDPFAKTFRVRLPFALAGAAGLVLWVLALVPALDGDRRRARLYAACFFLLASVSVSLLLHLREARYYPLLVLLGGAIFRVHLGYAVYGRVGFRRYTIELGLLLFLLFNTFFSAWFAFVALLGLDRVRAAWREGGRWRDLAPFALSALGVAPLLIFYETFTITATFAGDLALTLGAYAENLGTITLHLLRHEFLAPALLCHAAVLVNGVDRPASRRVVNLLAGFALGYVAIGCLNPLALERYFVPLGPLLIGLFLLDAFALMGSLPARAAPQRRRRVAALILAGLVGLTLVTRGPAFEEVRGRIAEITTPYRGPLDFAIPRLQRAYPRPEELVIATNYEEMVLMYYLGSRVIIGLVGNNLARDRDLEPDVVIPRRRWPRSQRELQPFLARGDWEAEFLPVRDLHFNNIPALSRSRFVPMPHRFRTEATADPGEQLVIYRRASSSKVTGTSSTP